MNTDEICRLGRNVIDIEASMISALGHRIDHIFAKSCQALLACQGRIIVTGIGKSGHIGKKIAATFASTGSPAFFIHPSEAKHGDIGMLTKQDVLLAISNSGESDELVAILPAIARLGIPLIAMTGKPTSSLAKSAHLHLDISVEKEACPLGLAPTSSTTAALVMGDALAMTLLHLRGFTETDFALSHPGGSLGKRLLLRVHDIMHKGEAIPLVKETDTLKQALVEMTRKKLGLTTVVNALGKLVGIFTDGDVRRALDNHQDIHATSMTYVMSQSPKTISQDILAAEALSLMETHQITALIITDPHYQPIGVVHIHDLLRAGVM